MVIGVRRPVTDLVCLFGHPLLPILRGVGCEFGGIRGLSILFSKRLVNRGQSALVERVVPPKSWRVSYAASGLVVDSLIS
jgi:hypothetical protein